MAQYDLLLTQNVHASGIEFSEKYVNIPKGGLLSALADGSPAVLAAGASGYHLIRDDAEVTGLKWVPIEGGHTQNTDTGTTASTFDIDSDGTTNGVKLKAATGVLQLRNLTDAAYADLVGKNATFDKVTVAAAPSAGTDLANKTYVDGLLAANDAMVFKGTVGTGGTLEIAAFNSLSTYNAGWAYKVITAGTIKGKVCEIGDLVIATVDRAGTGNVDGDWTVVQTNIDGAVTGPASSTDNYVALFSGTTGKLLKQGTGVLGTAAYTASTAYATAAQGVLADGAVPKSTFAANSVLYATTAATPVALTVGASTFVGRKATGDISTLSAAEARTVLNVADGATAKAKATSAEINTGTDDVKFATPLAIAGSTIVKGPASSTADHVAVFDGTTGKLLKNGGMALSSLMPGWVAAPASKTATGTAGQIARDDNFVYVCTATNVWKRSALATNW